MLTLPRGPERSTDLCRAVKRVGRPYQLCGGRADPIRSAGAATNDDSIISIIDGCNQQNLHSCRSHLAMAVKLVDGVSARSHPSDRTTTSILACSSSRRSSCFIHSSPSKMMQRHVVIFITRSFLETDLLLSHKCLAVYGAVKALRVQGMGGVARLPHQPPVLQGLPCPTALSFNTKVVYICTRGWCTHVKGALQQGCLPLQGQQLLAEPGK